MRFSTRFLLFVLAGTTAGATAGLVVAVLQLRADLAAERAERELAVRQLWDAAAELYARVELLELPGGEGANRGVR